MGKGYTTPSIYQLVAICYALNIKEGPSYFTKNFQKPALLNDIGQKKVAEYEMDLIASRRYQPDAEEPAEIDYIMMPVSELPVSAGLGAFLEGEMFQQIQVPASSVPAGAEFGIYVSGDSMEPRYHSGQIVWVKRCEELECGDIGIFVYDDCGYLKNTMNIPQTNPKQSSLPTAMAWCITNRFWFLLTPNIHRSLYLQSKDSRLLEKF